jgi:hypothetical protein
VWAVDWELNRDESGVEEVICSQFLQTVRFEVFTAVTMKNDVFWVIKT